MPSRFLAFLAALLVSTAAHAIGVYSRVEVLPPGADGLLSGVANDGTVVGTIYNADGTHTAFKWKSGALTPLGPGYAWAVNIHDLVVGTDEAGNIQAWSGGTITSLGVHGIATDVNEDGMIVGTWGDANGYYHPFSWADGQLTPLPDSSPQPATTPYGIEVNNRGQVLLGSTIYDHGTLTSIGIAGRDINDAGTVVGWGVYKNGQVVSQCGQGCYSSLKFVNNTGMMVGSGEGTYGYGFDSDNNSFILNHIFYSSGLTGVEATGLNDLGWILAFGEGMSGRYEHFLLVPTGPATSLSAPPPAPLKAAAPTDFNGDGKADLWWRRSSTEHGLWMMEGTTVAQANGFSFPNGFELIARGDRNGDGQTDVLWKTTAGLSGGYDVRGGTLSDPRYAAGTSLAALRGNWQLFASGDFNGDGLADSLFWSADYGYLVYLTAGPFGLIDFPKAAQVPAAIADFDGDGCDDILWRGDDGHYELYTMNGLTATAAGTVRAAGTGFAPTVIGDFNGDRRADIVWAAPDGTQSVWLMNGATPIDSTGLVGPGTGWRVTFAPDLDGDGKSDLLWTHADGSIGGWLMDGVTTRSYGLMLGGNTGWRAVATGDFDGNRTTDIVLRYTDGTYGIWLMNGLAIAKPAIVLGGGSGWEVVP